MKKILSGTMIACASLLAGACHAELVTVYTSANFAPLVVDGTHGVYADLIAYLNQRKLGDLTFKLAYLPRKRLQVKLEDGSLDGIVIGMMPQWLNDAEQKKYFWTLPFAHDRYVLVSNLSRPINSEQPASLAGKLIGLTLGYVYPGIDEWIVRYGLIRNDAPSEEKNLDKLLRDRVDCSVVTESMARYYIKVNGVRDKFKVAPVPGQITERRFLVPHANKAIFDKLAPIIDQLQDDAAWRSIMSHYE